MTGDADTMTTAGLITLTDDQFEPTDQGLSWFRDLGIDIAALRAARRSFARACLDWSERPHLAGATGAALAGRFLELGWIERTAHSRAVTPTPRAVPSSAGLSGSRPEGSLRRIFKRHPPAGEPRAVVRIDFGWLHFRNAC